MKVSEAKTKICPFIENSGEYAYKGATREYNYAKNIKCICGDCMAWQFTIGALGKKLDSESVDINNDENEGYCVRLSK